LAHWFSSNQDGYVNDQALAALGDLAEIVLQGGEVSVDKIRGDLRERERFRRFDHVEHTMTLIPSWGRTPG
jgi:hypothetical protein